MPRKPKFTAKELERRSMVFFWRKMKKGKFKIDMIDANLGILGSGNKSSLHRLTQSKDGDIAAVARAVIDALRFFRRKRRKHPLRKDIDKSDK